jgi:small subunit ribosomal protein S21
MIGIIVRPDEPFEKTMRRFTRVCEHSGVLSEFKKYRHYEKPSEERKRKRNASQQRLLREKINDAYDSRHRKKKTKIQKY